MSHTDIIGTGVALVTPFKHDLSVDYDALEKIINHVIGGKADFIVALGTTAETSMLTADERGKVVSLIKKINAGRLPIVLGYGGNCTAEMVEGLKQMDPEGLSALLVVTPFYVKPSQRGLLEHYSALADASPLPIILYNVPGRTGINMEPDTTLRLAEHPNISGIKEASGKLFQIEELLMRKPADFKLYSGDDALTLHLMNLGADGVISVMANVFPEKVNEIVDDCLSKEGLNTHYALKNLTKAIFIDGNPPGIKYLMSRLGLCDNILRLPLTPVSEETASLIDSCLAALR